MLDVGCGSNCQAGFVGMDRRVLKGVQIVHDCEEIPWPLADESCGVVVMSHLIEHIKPWLTIAVIDECWRVLEPGGALMIATPYATSFGYCQDPTHCNPWNEATPTYFDPTQPLYRVYEPRPWKIEQLAWNVLANLELSMKKIGEDEERDQAQ
jgi:predicted SAM-dependent methyltransferase